MIKKNKVNRSKKTLLMVQMAFLVALQIILTVSPIGFISLGVMTITLMHIPVLIGAMVMGPFAGGFLGLVFGISSMIKATNFGTPDAIVFSPFLTGSFKSVILSLVPRVLFGVITGVLFKKLIKNQKITQGTATSISAATGTIFHTIMVLGGIYILFANEYANNIGVKVDVLIKGFLIVFATNGLIEALVAVLICVKLVPTIIKYNNKGRS